MPCNIVTYGAWEVGHVHSFLPHILYCLLDRDADCLLCVLCWELCCGLLWSSLLFVNTYAGVNF